MDINPNQLFYDPSFVNIQPNFIPDNQMFVNQQRQRRRRGLPSKSKPLPSLANIPSLHLPAILLFAFSWLLHAIATFIPYWSTYSGIADSRAGLWSARNFNYLTIQNFYFPERTDFLNLTRSIRFTNANTKGYLITVQFLMTFNFVVMLIVLVLLIVDFIFARRSAEGPRSFLISDYNTSDTNIKYGLLLYIIYVFGLFEFAAWITYVGSRHDNNWHMHVSFAFAVIVSVFLIIVFLMYVIEFMKRFTKSRKKWEYWYGPYIEWGFFVYLSALLLLLIVICCPEWAYLKIDLLRIFAEIGPFKQCYLSVIYKKSISAGLCTLSDSRSNQSWINATQAFMLMAYIIGMIILFIIVYFRKEFRHNKDGYHSDRVTQPTFTFIIAGLILFFCFIFTLIGVSIFGGKAFSSYSLTANWAYIIAIFSMILFLIAGILFILDGLHSERQSSETDSSSTEKFFFPAPLSSRVLSMQPLIKPEPPWQPEPPIPPMAQLQPWQLTPQPWQQIPPFNFQQQPMYPPSNFDNGQFFPPQQMTMMPPNYGMEQYPIAPIAQAGLTHYFRQMLNNPQLSSLPYNQGLMNYSGDNPLGFSNNRNDILSNNNNNLNDMARLHFLQQQRLNYNHERLLERYNRLRTPRIAEFRTFGTSSLPGRSYDAYLQRIRGDGSDNPSGNSLAALSRAGIGSSDETYRWMGGDGLYEPLARDVSSVMQHSRNEPIPFVRAENFEPLKMYDHPIFGTIMAYIRPIYKKIKHSKTKDEEEIKTPATTPTPNDHYNDIFDYTSLGYMSHQNSKTKHERLIPFNPLLFDIYIQRLNGSIQSYGQLLYVPSSYHTSDRQLNHYEDIFTSLPSNTSSVLADISHELSSSSKHRYHKLYSQPASLTVSNRLSEPITTELTPSALSSNLSDTLNTPSLSFKPGFILDQKLSSSYTDPSTIVPIDSTQTSSNQRKIISFNSASSLLSRRRQKKKSITATDDINLSSSDD